MNSSEKHKQLKKLGRKSKDNLFEMLKLASEILKDESYCEEYGGQEALRDHLQVTDFSHFGGKPSLAAMLRAYEKNPEKSTWEDYQYNVWAMIELAKPPKESSDKQRINWKARAAELEVKVEMLEHEIATLQEKYDNALTKLGKLSSEHQLA